MAMAVENYPRDSTGESIACRVAKERRQQGTNPLTDKCIVGMGQNQLHYTLRQS